MKKKAKYTLETVLVNKQQGVILLEGVPTIAGQLAARKKALAACKKPNQNIYPNMLQDWITSHEKTILKLENLLNK